MKRGSEQRRGEGLVYLLARGVVVEREVGGTLAPRTESEQCSGAFRMRASSQDSERERSLPATWGPNLSTLWAPKWLTCRVSQRRGFR